MKDTLIREHTAAAILFAGSIRDEAFEKIFNGRSAFTLALKNTAAFPFVIKIVILAREDFDESLVPAGIEGLTLWREKEWNTQVFLEALARAGEGFDLSYFAWADTPFLDPELTKALVER
ncbi:MAG: spiro-SPASM protein, partial [Spirochaetaceae bacterium]|nr:spiro-SPASM protein [Spirochaetaceae bacterium]